MDLIRTLPISDMHVFPYSRRSGTKAAEMINQVPESIITARAKQLRELATNKKQQFLDANIGKELQVLVQKCEAGICHGLSRNYISVKFKGDAGMINTEQPVVCKSRNKSTRLDCIQKNPPG
jgi:threonylcarbamoyladenosine tRNA methylthiotransferase MtaB